MLKPLRYSLLGFAVEGLPSSRINELVWGMSLSAQDKRMVYQGAWENKKYEVMEELSREYVVRSSFHCVNEIFQQKAQSKLFHQLPILAFGTDGESFQEIVMKLTRSKYRRGLLKGFGKLTSEFGTVFLNNIHGLTKIYPMDKINFDRLLNLDHNQGLLPQMAQQVDGRLKLVLGHYTLERMFKVLCQSNPNLVADIDRMLDMPEFTQEVVSRMLPTKPKSLREIHDAVSKATLRTKKINRVLDQEISYLHGEVLIDYIIEVPSESYDLISTSEELSHCVHGYDKAIVRRESQVLNLVKDQRRHYTIELKPVGSSYRVVQFRGKCNESSMEGPAGHRYVSELMKILKKRSAE